MTGLMNVQIPAKFRIQDIVNKFQFVHRRTQFVHRRDLLYAIIRPSESTNSVLKRLNTAVLMEGLKTEISLVQCISFSQCSHFGFFSSSCQYGSKDSHKVRALFSSSNLQMSSSFICRVAPFLTKPEPCEQNTLLFKSSRSIGPVMYDSFVLKSQPDRQSYSIGSHCYRGYLVSFEHARSMRRSY